ncbi:nucleoside monophosphate kinase [bacterium]|nr:nucleoside monophosphate kinase [bacterium]
MKRKFIFLGPPACGKGTQTGRLAKYLNFPHIDTGSLLRAEIAKQTDDGKIAQSYIDKGNLVPVSLVATIIGKRLAQKDCENGYVLDGYPRSLEQAEKLEEINSQIDGDTPTSFKAIYFDIDMEILIERIINRQSCPKCGEIYNKKFKPSKKESLCDNCNVELTTRADDNEEIARARFNTYFEQTAPLIDFYKNKNMLYNLDANGSIEEVWDRLLKIVEA